MYFINKWGKNANKKYNGKNNGKKKGKNDRQKKQKSCLKNGNFPKKKRIYNISIFDFISRYRSKFNGESEKLKIIFFTWVFYELLPFYWTHQIWPKKLDFLNTGWYFSKFRTLFFKIPYVFKFGISMLKNSLFSIFKLEKNQNDLNFILYKN